MRDAFGGAFSIKLMLIFLVLYISFICVAINYARAFRVKNRIINIIEQHEGYNANDTTITSEINTYLANSGYHIDSSSVNEVSSCSELQGLGYCVVQISTQSNYDVYRVETYMSFQLPIINVDFPIAIRGETRIIP